MVGTCTTFFSSNGEVAETNMRAVVARTFVKGDDLEAIRSILCGTTRDAIIFFFKFDLRTVLLARCGVMDVTIEHSTIGSVYRTLLLCPETPSSIFALFIRVTPARYLTGSKDARFRLYISMHVCTHRIQ